jgi:hypothetical protein
MPIWKLIVQTKNGDFPIPVGKDESVALRTLAEERKHIGKRGTVTIADRLSILAEDIVSIRIEEQSDMMVG